MSDPLILSRLRVASLALVAIFFAAISPAHASIAEEVVREVRKEAGSVRSKQVALHRFYADRRYTPIWIKNGRLRAEAPLVLDYLRSAHLDGLEPQNYQPSALERSLEKATTGSPKALAEAEIRLSSAFAKYVQDQIGYAPSGMTYLEQGLAPSARSSSSILTGVANASSLKEYLENSSWMHPAYGVLRRTAATNLEDADQRILGKNLLNARALPRRPGDRHILVDAATARLFMYEGDDVVGEMKVVVGKASDATPKLAGVIRYVVLNPYWNVPPDLVSKNIAPHVIKSGTRYLRSKRYEVLSDWTNRAEVVDPSTVDWKAVASGKELRVRQLPGRDNAMGKVKFMFPNELGIYLHDTPSKELFHQEDRQFSAGCVRLEDAAGLAKWLYGDMPSAQSDEPEQPVNLPEPVPVYITYLNLP